LSPLNPNRAPRTRTITRSFVGRRIVAEGVRRRFWSDFYYYAMTAPWTWFFAILAALFVALNVAFALVYWMGDAPIANARPDSLSDLFFFSVETTSTVGYGDMHPQTMYGHLVATAENFVGVASLAVMTGLVFSRFSRPRARLIFARNPVVSLHDGVRTLTFRVANERSSFITEATARLWMLGPVLTKENRRFVGFQPMKLIKSENPMFALTWTLFHPIDDESPLNGMEPDEIAGGELNFILSLSGYDDSSAQAVRSRQAYSAQDLRFGYEFVDVVTVEPDGSRRINYLHIHDLRPVEPQIDAA
jgi:inward rectifier potassium channel